MRKTLVLLLSLLAFTVLAGCANSGGEEKGQATVQLPANDPMPAAKADLSGFVQRYQQGKTSTFIATWTSDKGTSYTIAQDGSKRYVYDHQGEQKYFSNGTTWTRCRKGDPACKADTTPLYQDNVEFWRASGLGSDTRVSAIMKSLQQRLTTTAPDTRLEKTTKTLAGVNADCFTESTAVAAKTVCLSPKGVPLYYQDTFDAGKENPQYAQLEKQFTAQSFSTSVPASTFAPQPW